MPLAFLCAVALIHDADTLRCLDGTRIRIAAVSARELDGTCNSDVPCPPMRPADATRIVQRMTLGRTISCQQVGTSYKRVVADCKLPDGQSLSCAIVASGAASWWPRYASQYRMRPCK